MPLTEAGKEQARVLGRALKEADFNLDAIVSGPLSRTKVFAEIAAELAGFKGQIRIDPRLRELDFGAWSGLSDDDVAQRFGQAALDNWRKHGVPHAPAKWAPSETEIRANIAALAKELSAPEKWEQSYGSVRHL